MSKIKSKKKTVKKPYNKFSWKAAILGSLVSAVLYFIVIFIIWQTGLMPEPKVKASVTDSSTGQWVDILDYGFKTYIPKGVNKEYLGGDVPRFTEFYASRGENFEFEVGYGVTVVPDADGKEYSMDNIEYIIAESQSFIATSIAAGVNDGPPSIMFDFGETTIGGERRILTFTGTSTFQKYSKGKEDGTYDLRIAGDIQIFHGRLVATWGVFSGASNEINAAIYAMAEKLSVSDSSKIEYPAAPTAMPEITAPFPTANPEVFAWDYDNQVWVSKETGEPNYEMAPPERNEPPYSDGIVRAVGEDNLDTIRWDKELGQWVYKDTGEVVVPYYPDTMTKEEMYERAVQYAIDNDLPIPDKEEYMSRDFSN